MLNEEQINFLDILTKSLGNVSVAIQQLGIDRTTYEGWTENIFFNERLQQITESSLDYVEQQLMKQIQEGNV